MAKKDIQNFEKALTDDERVELFLSKNWKKVLLATVVIVVVVVGVFAFKNSLDETKRNASAAFNTATMAELPALLEHNSDIPGAGIARLRLAQSLFNEKKYADAAAQFAAFSQDQNVPAELRSRARLSSAACWEAAGDKEQALSIYLTVANDAAMSAATHYEAAYQAGRLYVEQGKNNEAVAILNMAVQAKMPESANVGYAEMAAMSWQSLCKNLLDGISK